MALPLPYDQFFQLIIVLDALIAIALYAGMKRVGTGSEYYGLLRGLTIFMVVVWIGLVVSYVAQATFMGWI
ncbi:hypothetical protein [[Eubacterium] cellulosolvens]